MNIPHSYEQIPDGVKVATAISAPALSFLGIDLHSWTYILSGIVSILFIIDKIPMLYERIKQLKRYIDEKRGKAPRGE